MKFLIAILFAAILNNSTTVAQSLPLVPKPSEVTVGDGQCKLPHDIWMVAPFLTGALDPLDLLDPNSLGRTLDVFEKTLERMTRGRHRLILQHPADKPFLNFSISKNLAVEEYLLQIGADQIRIEASSNKGFAHACATLVQLIGAHPDGLLPIVEIADKPSSDYRSFMIDMGRNPHSFELLKETIDLLWFYKVDSLHLHLTDDQRFAFPSTAFPKLWDGLISLDEFKQLEAYAVERGVTIIPELDVPGHSTLLRAKYPEVFGKTTADLATDEAALSGIKTLLDEMADVFQSSPYVHIGGDEAGGVPEEAQRNLINKLYRHLKSKGKQTLVWEGPGPGKGDNKVHDDVIHINWRTINYPADQMLADGHRVVNAAWDPLYLVDHYPRINFTMTSPQHIFETLQLTRFKHVNPGIRTFSRPIDVKPTEKLIGFCMPWWEGREENFFPQVVPRVIPFAEVAWNGKGDRGYASFQSRVKKTEAARIAAFYPVSIIANDLAIQSDGVFHNKSAIELNSGKHSGTIRFTTDGSQPTNSSSVNTSSLMIDKTTVVRAALFKDGKQIGHGSRRTFTAVQPMKNLALGKPVSSSASSGSPFSIERITDGGTGNLDFYLGYPAEPEPIEITIDLEESYSISRITVFAYTISNSFEKYLIEVSADGKTYEEVASRLEKPAKATAFVDHEFSSREAQFIRIKTFGNEGYVFDSFSKIVEVQVFE